MNTRLFLSLVVTAALVTVSAAADFVYLSDIDWTETKGWYEREPRKDLMWQTGTNLQLVLNGTTYQKGLSANPGWGGHHTVTYDLNGEYTRFTAIVGIDDYAFRKPRFEWVIVYADSSYPDLYRGCKTGSRDEPCEEVDHKIPYWPGNDDRNNEYSALYHEEHPDRYLVMTRPACSAWLVADGEEIWNSGNMERSETIETPPQTIDVSVAGVQELVLHMSSHGTQHAPYEEGLYVPGCPWRDIIDWADAKLYASGEPEVAIAGHRPGRDAGASLTTLPDGRLQVRYRGPYALAIYDTRGRLMHTCSGSKAGTYCLGRIARRAASSGTFLVRLNAGGQQSTMLLPLTGQDF